MSGWSDIAYKAALTNPDIVVADDSTMPAAPREGHYNARHDGNRYIASQVPTEAQEQVFLFDWIDANPDRIVVRMYLAELEASDEIPY